MEIFKLFGSIFIDNEKANDSIAKTDKKGRGLVGTFGQTVKSAAKVGVAISGAAVLAGGAVTALATKTGDYADRILDLNSITGMSTDAIQEWQYVAGQAGVDIEAVTKAQEKLTKQMNILEEGTGKQSEALAGLGLSYQDLQSLSPDEQIDSIIKSLSGVEDPAERARYGTDLLGSSWSEIAPIVSMGANAIEDAKGKANDLGTVLSNDALNNANNFRMAMEDLKSTLGGAAMQIGSKVAPLLTNTLIPAFQTALPYVIDFTSGLVDGIGKGIEWISKASEKVKTWIENNKETLNNVKSTIMDAIGFVKEYIAGYIQYISDLFSGGGNLGETFMKIFTTIKSTAIPILQDAISFIMEIVGQLQQFWTENGDQIVQAVQNAFSLIASIIEFVMPAIELIIRMVWGNIKGIISGAIDVIMGAIKIFSGLFTGDFSKMWEGIKQMFSGAIEFVWNLINLMMFGRIFGGIKSFITKGIGQFKSFFTKTKNIFKNLDTSVVGIVKGLWSKVTGFFDDIAKGGKSKFSDLLTSAKSKFNSIRDSIVNPILKAKNQVKGFIDDIRGFFSRLKLSLPNIKMPHFKVKNWSWNPKDWIKSPPSLGVEWYAKGTESAKGGWAVIGEHGPELMKVEQGAKVKTAAQSRGILDKNNDETQRPVIIKLVLDGQEWITKNFGVIKDLLDDDLEIELLSEGVKEG
ncbi:phage tail protein [Bacillus sp. 2205SS5-2]|uniref:phage tail protein n=1 Tax=Bacillus sp. 2205SS5-2 TaxID=3109031 RepID=UPI003007C902